MPAMWNEAVAAVADKTASIVKLGCYGYCSKGGVWLK